MTQQPTLDSVIVNTKIVYDDSHRRQKEIIAAVIDELIIRGNMPMSTVSQPWFTSFMTVMDPKFAMPSRYKVSKLITNQFESQKSILQSKLQRAEWVSLTIDMWSDRRMRSFLGITVHFVNSSMTFESYLLDCASFEGSHTGQKISDKCTAIVENFQIQEKVAFVVTDNAANMVKAFQESSELFASSDDIEGSSYEQPAEVNSDESDDEESPMMMDIDVIPSEAQVLIESLDFVSRKRVPCVIHTLQLAVLDALKSTKCLSTVQAKTCRLSSVIHTSTSFSEEYFKVFKATVPRTTNTRWNSMFLQLAAVKELDVMKLKILLTVTKHEECILTTRELKTLQEAVSLLEVAYDATLLLEEEDALISIVGPTMAQIHKKWTNMQSNLTICEPLAVALLSSVESRFKGLLQNIGLVPHPLQSEGDADPRESVYQPFSDSLYLIAAALDPQFGLDWLDDSKKPVIEG
jgi:hypothetical protein